MTRAPSVLRTRTSLPEQFSQKPQNLSRPHVDKVLSTFDKKFTKVWGLHPVFKHQEAFINLALFYLLRFAVKSRQNDWIFVKNSKSKITYRSESRKKKRIDFNKESTMICNKTPISLMNEICKANNLMPEYKVVEESGPPHEKSFKVELKLQDIGSYEGIATTIRGAKHKAAQLGLETSGLKKPERKPKRSDDVPSVELNSLAMKHGKVVEYRDLPYGMKPHTAPAPIPSAGYGGYPYPDYTPGMLPYRRPQMKMSVMVKVGDKEYFGEGFRKKEARRNAASKALADLRKEMNVEPKVEKNQASGSVSSEIPEPKVSARLK